MRRHKRLICICLVVLQLLIFVGCDGGESQDTPKEEMQEQPPALERDYCRIYGENLYFLTDEELESLREPLTKLLSNREDMFNEQSDYGPFVPDPDSPSIVDCYSCGLFDVTADGIPELIVHLWGSTGSSGYGEYIIYDIKTGEDIGSIGMGWGSMCNYYNTENQALAWVINHGMQSGYEEQYVYLNAKVLDSVKKEFVTDISVSAHYSLPGLSPDEDDKVVCYINGEKADWHEYDDMLYMFYVRYVRIPETEFVSISWGDVSTDEDDRFVRAEKMANALLSSGQKFIVPDYGTEKNFGDELCLTKSN